MVSIIEDLISKLCCCLPLNNNALLRINRTVFKIIKLLGEGGFSYVYLVELRDGSRYALKKIRCAYGSESIKNAMREANAYKEFNSPYVVRSIDTSIVEEKDGLKSVYILLPYFSQGTLQDLITSNVIKGVKIDEQEALRLFIGVCRGLQVMHRHKLSAAGRHANNDVDMEIQRLTRSSGENAAPGNDDDAGLSAGEADVLLLDSDEEDEEALANDARVHKSDFDDAPDTLMDSNTLQDVASALNNSNNDTQHYTETTEMGDAVPYAHRDIKPGNVMFSEDGIPVLCDLGSCAKARMHIQTRLQALALQDLAAEHCTLPYRAPELLDVATGSYIDERVDIWSLGCTLYALLYGSSPFERAEAESGASVSLAISSGKYSFPADNHYSEDIKELILYCLHVDPKKRPTVEQVMSKALSLTQ